MVGTYERALSLVPGMIVPCRRDIWGLRGVLPLAYPLGVIRFSLFCVGPCRVVDGGRDLGLLGAEVKHRLLPIHRTGLTVDGPVGSTRGQPDAAVLAPHDLAEGVDDQRVLAAVRARDNLHHERVLRGVGDQVTDTPPQPPVLLGLVRVEAHWSGCSLRISWRRGR